MSAGRYAPAFANDFDDGSPAPSLILEKKMAVQKSRKTPSRRGMRRSHDKLTSPSLSVDPTSGETHMRHRVTADGFYRGTQVVVPPEVDDEE